MEFWKTAVLSAVLLGAAAAGAALAPAAHGQTPAVRTVTPRPLQILASGGGRIGVSVSDIEGSDVKASSGVVIESVEEDSPAAEAGMRKGDVVVEFDGERVRSVRQFTRLVSETPAGRRIAAAVMRDGQRVSLNLTTREASMTRIFDDSARRSVELLRDYAMVAPPAPARPARPARPTPAPRPPAIESFVWSMGNQLGVTVNSLSDQLAEYFGTKEGILVASVTDGSAAAKAGVRAGDVIVSVNGQTVRDAAALRRQMQTVKSGEEFALGIVRDRKSQTLRGKLETTTRRRTTRTIL
jgi:serine protease Do